MSGAEVVGVSFSFLENVDFWINVGVLATTYGVFSLGIQLNVGTTGIFNFGQAGFMAVGSYAMGVLVVKSGVSFWLALVAGIGVAVAAGLLVGLPSLRLRADYFAISTLAFSEIVRYVADNWDGLTGGNLGLFGYADA
jgi:branched-chain amino acid transport system permease protein